MNYFEYHLGDYAKDAGHLTMLRDGAYIRLMAAYYGREKPLPLDPKQCFELTRCISKADRDAVAYVLANFFEKREDGYHQKRCDEEIARFKGKSEAGRSNANARWSHVRNGSNGNAAASDSHVNGNAPNLQSQSPVPSKNPTPTPPKGGADSHRRSPARAEKDQALEVWNRLTGSNGAEPPRDSRLQAAIDAVGGWTRIAQRERGIDDQRVRQDFVEAYRGAS